MYKIPALFIQLSRWWIKSWFFSNSQHQESHIPRKSLILNLKSLFWIVYLKFFPYNPQFCGSPAVKPYPHDPKPDPILTTVVHIAPTYSPCFRTEVHISKHIAKCIVFAYTKISQATMVVGNKLWETDCAVFVGWTEEKKRDIGKYLLGNRWVTFKQSYLKSTHILERFSLSDCLGVRGHTSMVFREQKGDE